MSTTAGWRTGAVTAAWRPRAPRLLAMPAGSREVLHIEIPNLQVTPVAGNGAMPARIPARIGGAGATSGPSPAAAPVGGVEIAIVAAGWVPQEGDWRACVYTGGVAMLLHTADGPDGLYAVWVRVTSGIELVLRVAATLVVEPGPASGLPDPDATTGPPAVVSGGMPARIPARIGDAATPTPGTTAGAGAMPARIPARIGEPGASPGPAAGPGAMPSRMPASIGSTTP